MRYNVVRQSFEFSESAWSAASFPLVASTQRDRLRKISKIGRNFRGEEAELDWGEITAIVAFVVGCVAVVWGAARYLDKRERNSGVIFSRRGLFRELCQAHQLRRQERRLLKSLAKSAGLLYPAQAFIRPDIFSTAAFSAGKQDAYSAQVTALRARLFHEATAASADAAVLSPPSSAPVPATASV